MSNWNTKPAHEIVAAITSGETTARAVMQDSLAKIARVEPDVKAFLRVMGDSALERADGIDALRAAGKPLPPLAGVPVALKDNMAMRGVETTCASRILKGWKPPYNATVVERLEAAGAIIVGKANMDEFAMGSSTENSAYQVTHNPWDTDRVPGGSSGGSAAAVAAGETPVAIGSDTGGSIRQPASFCGVVGVKPTYGRVSRYGLVAFASSLDQIGPLTRDVRDAALLLNVMAGHDACDSTSIDQPAPDFAAALEGGVKGLTIGRPIELFGEGLEEGTRAAVAAALARFEELGARVVDVSLPYLRYTLPVYYIIAPCEASSNLARYDGVRYGHRTDKDADMIEMYLLTREEGFGAEVKRRIMIGTYALSSGYYDAWYKKAQQVRTLIRRDFDAAYAQCDMLMAPVSPIPAFRIGEMADDPYQMWLSDICTLPINLAGVPAMSIPAGFSNGLPVGLQIIGKPLDECAMLRAAYAYEQSTDWHTKLSPAARA
ncbi:MAG TPA: Asp-tRNA(Asn)/Glu-tRNA(Gln) amidotransferase subunit GatA [Armatimonadota bacterium]|jgi:aspartyl-tRNA(Asn)/glutamyl-tRNA(Gln) amidotransferase subunit A